MNKLSPLWLLSRLLEKLGQKTYVQRVELAAHLGWSIAFALLGLFIWWPFALGMVIFALVDELIFDKHWMLFHPTSYQGERYQGDPLDWKDCLWDLGSKALIPFIILIILLI